MTESQMSGRMDFLTKHFAVLSVLATVIAAALSYTFATGYLLFIDPGFVWFIEYTDLSKFGFLFALLAVPILYNILSAYGDRTAAPIVSNRHRLITMIPFTIMTIILFVMFLTTNLFSYHWGINYSIFDAALLPVAATMVRVFVDDFTLKPYDFRYLSWLCIFAFVSVFCIGIDRGLAQLQGNASKSEITMKPVNGIKSVYSESVLITALSHNTLILVDAKPVIIRTEEIESISSARK